MRGSQSCSSDRASVSRQPSVEEAPERVIVSPLLSPDESQQSYGSPDADCKSNKTLEFFLSLDGNSDCGEINGKRSPMDFDESVHGIRRSSIDSYFKKRLDHRGQSIGGVHGSKKTSGTSDLGGNQPKPKKSPHVSFEASGFGQAGEISATSNVAEVQPIRRCRFSTDDLCESESGTDLASGNRIGAAKAKGRRFLKLSLCEKVS